MDISRSFAKINKIPIPSPGQEMEVVLSINHAVPDKVQDVAKMENSF